MDLEMRFPGGKKVDAIYEGFTINTDQPEKMGGENTAPAPFDLFIASIGTCAGFYVLSFCQKRDIPLDGAKLFLHTEKDEKSKLTTKISIDIHLPPGFPEKYRNAVIRSVEQCSVTRHFHNPPEIIISTETPV